MIRKSMPSDLIRGWKPVFPRDKREAFARRSCSNKNMTLESDFNAVESDSSGGQSQQRPRQGRRRRFLKAKISAYLDDSLIQSSCARRFSRFQSLAATSQFTMVRLADAV